MEEQTNDTNFMVEGVVPEVYFFAVLAVNSLGQGKGSNHSFAG